MMMPATMGRENGPWKAKDSSLRRAWTLFCDKSDEPYFATNAVQ